MASPNVDTGFGTTVAFATSTALNSLKLIDINHSGGDRPMIETTNYGSGAEGAGEIGNAEFIPSDVMDPGAFDFVWHFNPDTDLPGTGVAENVTVTWASGATWVFSGAIQSFSVAAPMKEAMTLNATVKCLGPITVTAAP